MQFFHVSQGPIAQLVEQLTFNQLVPRSSRGRSTILVVSLLSILPYSVLA